LQEEPETPALAETPQALSPSEELPGWDVELQEEIVAPVQAETPSETHPAGGLSGWLAEFSLEEDSEEESQSSQALEEAAIHEKSSGWLEDYSTETEEPLQADNLATLENELIREIGNPPDFENIEAAIDWLENVTASMDAGETMEGKEELPLDFVIPSDLGSEKDTEIPTKGKLSNWILETSAQESVSAHEHTQDQLSELSEQIEEIRVAEFINAEARQRVRININKASLTDLEKLPGVSFRMAQNILNYRQSQGEIRSLEDLRHLPKMDSKQLAELSEWLTFKEEETKNIESPSTLSQIETLAVAQASIMRGDLNSALEQYTLLIRQKTMLEDIIHDLSSAAQKYPDDIHLLQILGEAYLAVERFAEALDTYRKAEEILQ